MSQGILTRSFTSHWGQQVNGSAGQRVEHQIIYGVNTDIKTEKQTLRDRHMDRETDAERQADRETESLLYL